MLRLVIEDRQALFAHDGGFLFPKWSVVRRRRRARRPPSLPMEGSQKNERGRRHLRPFSFRVVGSGSSDPSEAVDRVQVLGAHLLVADAEALFWREGENADLALVL